MFLNPYVDDFAAQFVHNQENVLNDEHASLLDDAMRLDFTEPEELDEGSAVALDKWWALRKIRALPAWQYSPAKGKGQKIALIGAACSKHEELESDALIVQPDDAKSPNSQLGTCVASIAVSRQSGEITGSAPSAQVIAPHQQNLTAAEQVAIAQEAGARVLVLLARQDGNEEIAEALNQARSNGTIILIAADLAIDPALLSSLIVVSGSSHDDRPYEADHLSVGHVSFAAPAEHVWSASVQGENAVSPVSGAVCAAALIAGVAALWRAHHGETNLNEIAKSKDVSIHHLFEKAVTKTVRCPNHWDEENHGAGIIDAEALLRLPLDHI